MTEVLIDISIQEVFGVQGLTDSANRIGDHSERHKLLSEFANIYFRSINSRFSTLSSGGGEWPPIKKSAQKSKIVGARGRNAILIDTLTLVDATRASGGRGQIRDFDEANFRVTLGIGGSEEHPRASNSKETRTIGFIAEVHHFGLGRNPERPIIVPPNPNVREKMRQRALVWLLKKVKGK
jgi:hypothetical protein